MEEPSAKREYLALSPRLVGDEPEFIICIGSDAWNPYDEKQFAALCQPLQETP